MNRATTVQLHVAAICVDCEGVFQTAVGGTLDGIVSVTQRVCPQRWNRVVVAEGNVVTVIGIVLFEAAGRFTWYAVSRDCPVRDGRDR